MTFLSISKYSPAYASPFQCGGLSFCIRDWCFFAFSLQFSPSGKPHERQPDPKSQFILEITEKLRTFAKLWHQWYVCQTGPVVSHLMKSPTEWQCPVSTLATQSHTVLHNSILAAQSHTSTLCHTSQCPHCPQCPLCVVAAAALFRRGLWRRRLGPSHNTHFAKSPPLSRIHDQLTVPQGCMVNTEEEKHTSFYSKTCLALPEGTRAGTPVSELLTLTKRLSKSGHSCLFIQLFNFRI